MHSCRLVPHPEKYQSSSESESIIEPTTSPSRPKETSNILISEENNMEEELGTPNDHVEQHQTVRDGPTKQNSIRETIELPKPGQTIECKLTNDDDSEGRKLNVISRTGKSTGKNKHLMNVALEQGKTFWLDFEHGVLEWKASEIRPTSDDEHTFDEEENIMISSSDYNLETAKKEELQSWVKNKVYTQIYIQGQLRISTRWVYTYKNLTDKQVCKARFVVRGFQDRDVDNIRNDSPTYSKKGLHIALAIMASNH